MTNQEYIQDAIIDAWEELCATKPKIATRLKAANHLVSKVGEGIVKMDEKYMPFPISAADKTINKQQLNLFKNGEGI